MILQVPVEETHNWYKEGSPSSAIRRQSPDGLQQAAWKKMTQEIGNQDKDWGIQKVNI